MNDIDVLIAALREAKLAGVTQIVIDGGHSNYLEEIALASTEIASAPNGDKVFIIKQKRDRSSPYEMIDNRLQDVVVA